jgi:hypothetical protein
VIPAWWSVSLAALGIAGIWLTGQKDARGWILGVAAQVLWIAYAVATAQWGFILSALAYGFVYARGWHRWRQDERRAP